MPASREQLGTRGLDPRPPRSLVAAAVAQAADEETHLLQHLANPGDAYAASPVPSAASTAPPGNTNAPAAKLLRPGRRSMQTSTPPSTSRSSATVLAGMGADDVESSTHGMSAASEHDAATDRETMRVPMSSHLEVALELADIADAITTTRFQAPDLRIDAKPDSTPVTDADRTTEQALRNALQRLRPGQEIVGEEFGGDGQGEWRWILDPIDGTVNYANGVPVWATLIALMRGDRAVCGVVSAPALGRRWWAATGEGAFTGSGQRIHVSRTPTLEEAYVSCTDVRDFATRRGERGFRTVLQRARVVRAFGDFWSHMLVAEGVIDVALEAWVNPWDVAATQVILIEAGGRFSDFDGAMRIDSGNVITTTGLLHDELVRLMGEADRAAKRD